MPHVRKYYYTDDSITSITQAHTSPRLMPKKTKSFPTFSIIDFYCGVPIFTLLKYGSIWRVCSNCKGDVPVFRNS